MRQNGESWHGDRVPTRHQSGAGYKYQWHDKNGRATTGDSWGKASSHAAGKRRAKQVADAVKATLFTEGGELKLGRRHRPDYLVLVLMVILSAVGLVTLISIIPAITGGDDKEATSYIVKQIILLTAGLLAFAVANKIPLDFWRKYGVYVFLVALFVCFALPILGMLHVPLATCALGACRWYNLGVISFQPAEFLKLGTVFFVSGFLAVRAAQNKLSNWRTLAELGAVMLVAMAIIVGLQKDMGTGVALAAIVAMQLFIAGVDMRKLAILAACVVAALVIFIIIAPHRMERVMTFFGNGNSETDYHITQALIALGSGGLTGRGLGQSVQAFGWLPEAVNDSIFAVFGEMVGFVGVFALIVGFALLLKSILDKIDYTDNMYLRLVLAGVFGWLCSHVLLNIGAMAHIIPLTGITLPLVSFGGTSLVFIMFSLGVVFAISHYTSHRRVDEIKLKGGLQDETTLRWGRQRRPHNTNSGDSRQTSLV